MKPVTLVVLFLSFLHFAFAASCPGDTPPTSGMQLLLLLGQSNMAGRGAVSAMSDPTELPPCGTATRIWMLDASNQWVRAQNPIHFDISAAGYGLASRVARILADADPNVTIGLIPCAVSGSSLASWMPGTTRYNNAVSRAQLAQSRGTIAAILWHQGESDSSTASGGYLTYKDRFAEMIGNLRHDLGAQAAPVIAGEIGAFHANAGNINPVLATLGNNVPFCLTASSASAPGETMTSNGDGTHFNTSSLEFFGERYLANYLDVKSWRNHEAEALTWTNSGGSIDVFTPGLANAEASMESSIIFKATATGQWAQASIAGIPAGTYSVRVRFKRYNARGECQVAIDGVNQGSPIQQFATTASYFQAVLGPKTFTGTGSHTFRFTVTGKHASSSSYYISVDSIILRPL